MRLRVGTKQSIFQHFQILDFSYSYSNRLLHYYDNEALFSSPLRRNKYAH
jgi:hypothetical protein